MKSEFESKKDLIGVDEGIAMSVVKLKDFSLNFIGANKGIGMPVVQLGNNSFFNFIKVDW